MSIKPLNKSESRRFKTYTNMTPELQTVSDRFARCDLAMVKNTLLARHEIGAKLNEIVSKKAIHGSDAVGQMAHYLGWSKDFLNSLRSIAAKFTCEEIENAAHRRMSEGPHISLEHLIWLATIEEPTVRRQYLDLVFEKSLTTRELVRELKTAGLYRKKACVVPDLAKVKPNTGAHEPSAVPPTSPLMGATEIQRRFQKLNMSTSMWTEHVFDRIDELEPDKCKPALVNKLSEAAEEVRKLRESIPEIRRRLSVTLSSFRNILAHREHAELPRVEDEFPEAPVAEHVDDGEKEVDDDPMDDFPDEALDWEEFRDEGVDFDIPDPD